MGMVVIHTSWCRRGGQAVTAVKLAQSAVALYVNLEGHGQQTRGKDTVSSVA